MRRNGLTLHIALAACCSGIIITGSMQDTFARELLSWRKQLVLETAAARVGVDLGGGAIFQFQCNDMAVNPLSWNLPERDVTEPQPMGHFICFDRWGQPSEKEQANGMPFHGEAPHIEWAVTAEPVVEDGVATARMRCALPIGGLELTRTLSLSPKAPVLTVTEEITNLNKLGRLYNIVQHPSIAPPFLDASTLVDCNARRGYLQESSWPTPEEPVIYWPEIAYKGRLVDLRRLAGDHNPGVTSFVFDDDVEIGWVTAASPSKELLIGYIWDVDEYPWLNIWRNSQNGEPFARGLEFGTTGLHQPFGRMVEKGSMFGRPLFEYIDAGQTITKSYVAFLAKVPKDYRGVASIEYSEGKIVLTERGEEGGRTIELTY